MILCPFALHFYPLIHQSLFWLSLLYYIIIFCGIFVESRRGRNKILHLNCMWWKGDSEFLRLLFSFSSHILSRILLKSAIRHSFCSQWKFSATSGKHEIESHCKTFVCGDPFSHNHIINFHHISRRSTCFSAEQQPLFLLWTQRS